MTRFLSSRLLFLITISGGDPIATLVEDLNIANYLSRRLQELLDEITTPSKKSSSQMQSELLTEYLKVAFNVSLFYPRVVEERRTNPGNNNKRLSPNKGKGKVTSSPMSRNPSSSSTSSSSSSGSRSSSPAENSSSGRTSPKISRSDNHGTSSSSNGATNGRSKSPSNLPRAATEKIKGYFSRNKGKEAEKVSNMYHEDADVLRPWGFEK